MKHIKFVLLLGAMFIFASAEAKIVKEPEVFMFGFSASFKDSTVYLTDIQKLDSVWIESKGNYVLFRDEYSRQIKNYLATNHSAPNRTCVVFYAFDRKKAEKQYLKMRNTYTSKSHQQYDIRYLTSADFLFKRVEIAPADTE